MSHKYTHLPNLKPLGKSKPYHAKSPTVNIKIKVLCSRCVSSDDLLLPSQPQECLIHTFLLPPSGKIQPVSFPTSLTTENALHSRVRQLWFIHCSTPEPSPTYYPHPTTMKPPALNHQPGSSREWDSEKAKLFVRREVSQLYFISPPLPHIPTSPSIKPHSLPPPATPHH